MLQGRYLRVEVRYREALKSKGTLRVRHLRGGYVTGEVLKSRGTLQGGT